MARRRERRRVLPFHRIPGNWTCIPRWNRSEWPTRRRLRTAHARSVVGRIRRFVRPEDPGLVQPVGAGAGNGSGAGARVHVPSCEGIRRSGYGKQSEIPALASVRRTSGMGRTGGAPPGGPGKWRPSPAVDLLLSGAGHDAFVQALDGECTRAAATPRPGGARLRADPLDWEVFTRVVIDGDPLTAVAADMGCDDLAIRAAAFRAHRLLQAECRKIEDLF